jgi:hypothetical protein
MFRVDDGLLVQIMPKRPYISRFYAHLDQQMRGKKTYTLHQQDQNGTMGYDAERLKVRSMAR